MTDEREEQMVNEQERNEEMETAKATQSKLKRAWKPVAIVVLVGLLIVGEVVFQQAKRKGWITYTVEDGLASDQVESIAVAPNGEVWVGTWSRGVSHFDGETWTRYTENSGLADNAVRSIAVTLDGEVWVGTESGISRFDGETWTTYTENDNLVDNSVRSITVASDGVVWFGTGSGVSRFDGETWTTYTENDDLVDNSVRSIAVALDGALWFGTGSGISYFDGESWTTYTAKDGLATNYVQSIAIAPNGVVWVSTAFGVSRFDGETWTSYTEDDGLVSNYVASIAVAPNGVLWVGQRGDKPGLSRFDGEIWTSYIHANSVLATYGMVSALTFDEQGRVWIGTNLNGISILDERASLPAQTLLVWAQVWSVLRALSMAALVLLLVVWIVRSKSTTGKAVVLFLIISVTTYVIAVPSLFDLLVAVGFYVDSGALPALGALVLATPVAIGLASLVVKWWGKPR